MTAWDERIVAFVAEEADKANGRNLMRTPRVGFSSSDDPLFDEIVRIVGPHHLRPADILPDVKTVVSFFIPFASPVVEANRKEEPMARLWAVAYKEVNTLINHIGESLTAMVTAEGGRAAMVPATYTFDTKTLKAGWSHRSAAAVAGLGRFGLNRMLIGPDGCAGRYGTVFMSETVAPSRRDDADYCLAFKNDSCRACVKACPVGALSEEAFDAHKCYARCLSNSELFVIDGVTCDVCGKCVTACPVAIQ